MKSQSGRRQFLKGAFSILGGAITARAAGLFPEVQPVSAESARQTVPILQVPTQIEIGELYENFLLLPEEVPAPYFVQYPVRGIPYACGVGTNENPQLSLSGETKQFKRLKALVAEVEFPIYVPNQLPDGVRLRHISVTRYDNTYEVYNVMIGFETYNPEIDYWETTVIIEARPDYPRPLPLWYREPDGLEDIPVILEKVAYLPSPGIRIPTQAGYVYHWIKDEIFYTLAVEPSPNQQYAQQLVDTLTTLQEV